WPGGVRIAADFDHSRATGAQGRRGQAAAAGRDRGYRGGTGSTGGGTRSSNERMAGPKRNLLGRLPRTNGIHTAPPDRPAGSPRHGSTGAKLTLGGTGKSRTGVRGCTFCMKSSQIGTAAPPPVILSPIGVESSRPIHTEASRSVVKPLNHTSR